MQPISTLGGQNNDASAVNDRGQVVGASETDPKTGGEPHPFLWENGTVRDLGTLGGTSGDALAINRAAQVVGWARTSHQELHAFLWQNGKMTDLNKLLPSDSDWLLIQATSINARGQITGIGAYGGQYHGFLMSPR